MSSSVSYLRLR